MRARDMLTAAVVLVVADGGCGWRDFDSLRSATPVLVVQAPPEYPAGNDFSQLLIATPPPSDGSAAARFVTSALLQTAVTYVTVSSGGSASARLVTSPALDNLGQPVTAMAAIPGTDRALLAGGGTILTLDMSVSPPVVETFAGITPAVGAEPYLGVGLAAGTVTGGAAPDLVVASATALHVYVGGGSTELAATTSAACPIAMPANVPGNDRIQRPIVIGTFLGATPVIAIGTPGVGGPGHVSFFAADVTAGTLSCVFSLAAPQGEPDFGRALAVGDFNEDGKADLLVGAPPTIAYIFEQPIAVGDTGSVWLTSGEKMAGYGAAVAGTRAVGTLIDTAFVGSPGATINGQQGAGEVFVEAPVPTTGYSVLADRSAGTNEAYGSSVAALPFCPTPGCATPALLPLVGATSKAFVYFTIFNGAPDPRNQ